MSRFRRLSRALLLAGAVGVLMAPAEMAAAQTQGGVATVDQDRLFRQSRLGQSLLAEIDERGDALAAENRAIEAELTTEERALTAARSDLDPAEFRARAETFDEKVRRLRAEQDAEARALAQVQEDARARFVREVSPVLSALLDEVGADVLMDRRMVLAAGAGVDITDRAIARIDAELAMPQDGEGAAAPD